MPYFYYYKKGGRKGYIKENKFRKGVITHQVSAEGVDWLRSKLGQLGHRAWVPPEIIDEGTHMGLITTGGSGWAGNASDPNQGEFVFEEETGNKPEDEAPSPEPVITDADDEETPNIVEEPKANWWARLLSWLRKRCSELFSG